MTNDPRRAGFEADEVIVTLRLRFMPGRVEEVLDRLLSIVGRRRAEEGNRAFDVYRARDSRDDLIVFERWRDRAVLERQWTLGCTKEALTLFDLHLLQPLTKDRDVTYLVDAIRSRDQRAPLRTADLWRRAVFRAG